MFSIERICFPEKEKPLHFLKRNKLILLCLMQHVFKKLLSIEAITFCFHREDKVLRKVSILRGTETRPLFFRLILHLLPNKAFTPVNSPTNFRFLSLPYELFFTFLFIFHKN